MYRRPVPRRNGLSTNRPFKPPLKPRNSNQIDDNDSNSIDNGINDDNDALINDNDDKEKYFNVLWRQKKKKNWQGDGFLIVLKVDNFYKLTFKAFEMNKLKINLNKSLVKQFSVDEIVEMNNFELQIDNKI